MLSGWSQVFNSVVFPRELRKSFRRKHLSSCEIHGSHDAEDDGIVLCGFWRLLDLWMDTNVSDKLSVSIFSPELQHRHLVSHTTDAAPSQESVAHRFAVFTLRYYDIFGSGQIVQINEAVCIPHGVSIAIDGHLHICIRPVLDWQVPLFGFRWNRLSCPSMCLSFDRQNVWQE
jgi:hypothetical protein